MREKKGSEHPNPCDKSTGVPFMPLLSVIASFTTARSPKAWMVLQAQPGQPHGVQPGVDGGGGPAKQTLGVSGSESKSHLNPLIGNNSKFFRRDVATIRCKCQIGNLRKTECFCLCRSRISPCVFKFPSITLWELEFKVYKLITARVSF